MKVDILFLAKNRREYTEETLRQLERNTNWDLVNTLNLYDDGSEPSDYVTQVQYEHTWTALHQTKLGNPVAVMNHFLTTPWNDLPEVTPASWFAKIDNDTIVPPGWLDACVAVAETDAIDLIGIEARYCENAPMQPEIHPDGYYPVIKYRRTDHVGGIGLFRRRVFETHPLPQANRIYYGFTEWQWAHPDVRKCWIDPPLPVFLLDHIGFDPWRSLGKEYVRRGWQRESWGEYDEVKDRGLWEWWLEKGL